MSSSDSDSDDEERKKLASVVNGYEASVKTTPALVKNVFSSSKDFDDVKAALSNKKSLRNDVGNNDDFNVMKTTPEFRQFMSKKLDAYLEKEISDYPESTQPIVEETDNDEKGVVKLLKCSKVCLASNTLLEDATMQHNKSRGKRKPLKKSHCDQSSSDESDDEESKRFRMAAITPESILSGTAIKAHKE